MHLKSAGQAVARSLPFRGPMTLPRTSPPSHASETTGRPEPTRRRVCTRHGRRVELVRVLGARPGQVVSFQGRIRGVAPLLGFIPPDTWMYAAPPGVDLRELWSLTRARGGDLGRERVALILRPLARTLDALDVPHGRVDMDRVRVGADGPVLLEHGLMARLGHEAFGGEPLAPELLRGGKLTRSADVWGLARLACELVTLHPPGWSAWAVAGRRTGAVLARGMDEDPKRRPSSARQFVEALLAELSHHGDASEAPTRTLNAPPPAPVEREAVQALQAAELDGLGVWRRPGRLEPLVWLGFTGGLALLHVWTWLGPR